MKLGLRMLIQRDSLFHLCGNKNSFLLKIVKKYYIVVAVIADETDLQLFHVVILI